MKPGTRDMNEMEDGGVDAGLLLLSLYADETGRTFSIDEIAYVCGCSHGLIWYVERDALKKFRSHPRLRAAFSERFG
jgi:redox-regulated HSP33 family molecular chaperone